MKTSVKKYYLFHLLNDYSGSPSVLRQVAEVLSKYNEVHVVSSRSEGFLSDIEGTIYHNVRYSWNSNKLITLFNFFSVQLLIFFKVLTINKTSVVYINTLLPFGAALAGKLRGLEVIYHLHEPQVNPAMLFKFLKWVAKKTSSKQIYVSNYLEKELIDIAIDSKKVIHNSISNKFLDKAKEERGGEDFEVLMACSLKKYKGIYEFLELAEVMPNVNFKLILNSFGKPFESFLKMNKIPDNCLVLPSQSDMSIHYKTASVLINLSDKKEWVESFGLTLIEAMCHGLPVIGPCVGGPKEIIEDGKTGFCIDSKDQPRLIKMINLLQMDEAMYDQFSKSAISSCKRFTSSSFEANFWKFVKS